MATKSRTERRPAASNDLVLALPDANVDGLVTRGLHALSEIVSRWGQAPGLVHGTPAPTCSTTAPATFDLCWDLLYASQRMLAHVCPSMNEII
jgi:hypothetical protein